VAGGSSGGQVEQDTFAVGDSGPTEIGAMIQRLGALGVGVEWGVPALVMGVPGLLIILIVLAQSLGGAAWLPVVRRRIGGFGISGPRLPHRT
jgi:hypothetical protein